MVSNDSLYILVIVAVVAVIGLTIVATSNNNSVMMYDDLPDMSVVNGSSAIAGQAPGFQKPKVGTAGGMVVAVIKSQIEAKDAPLGNPDILVRVTSNEECTGDDCDEDDSDAVTEQDSSTKDSGSKDGAHGNDCPAGMLC